MEPLRAWLVHVASPQHTTRERNVRYPIRSIGTAIVAAVSGFLLVYPSQAECRRNRA